MKNNTSIPFIGAVVGTKADYRERRVISSEEGRDYAAKLGLPYFETSSKTGQGVEECFQTFLPRMIEAKVEQHKNSYSSVDLNNKNTKKVARRGGFSSFCNII